jgi:hypothetical protein
MIHSFPARTTRQRHEREHSEEKAKLRDAQALFQDDLWYETL